MTDTWPSREWSEVGIKGKNGEWKTTERIGIGGLSLQSLSSPLSFSLHGCGSYSEGTNIWRRMWLGVAALLLQINYWQSEPASWAITTLSVFSFNLKTKSSMVTKEFNVPSTSALLFTWTPCLQLYETENEGLLLSSLVGLSYILFGPTGKFASCMWLISQTRGPRGRL